MQLDKLIKYLQTIQNEKGCSSCLVSVMIETKDCQYQYPVNDVALVLNKEGYPREVVIMHEREQDK